MPHRIVFYLIQVVIVMAFAPPVSGVGSRLKEMVQSGRGPGVLQPYRHIWKLFHKHDFHVRVENFAFDRSATHGTKH